MCACMCICPGASAALEALAAAAGTCAHVTQARAMIVWVSKRKWWPVGCVVHPFPNAFATETWCVLRMGNTDKRPKLGPKNPSLVFRTQKQFKCNVERLLSTPFAVLPRCSGEVR